MASRPVLFPSGRVEGKTEWMDSLDSLWTHDKNARLRGYLLWDAKELEEKACMVKRRKGEILQQLQVLDRIAKVLSLSFYGKGGHLKQFSFFCLSWNTPWN